jgi:hypothetical protein
MKTSALLSLLSLWTAPLLAQDHQHHQMPAMDTTMQQHDQTSHSLMLRHEMPAMSHAYSRSLPMTRNGSGTSWLPDESPMYGYMQHKGKWMFMEHGNVFLRYNSQDVFNKGSRGGSQWDAPNWFMGMGQRTVGRNGLFHFSAMLSFDALVMGGSGYPLLFQSGETWEGKPLVDRQHPHDLFAELSIGYTHRINKDMDVFGYIGYPGEPAIGGTAFMHRPSAMYNPDAPLGHHWQDATHITFGVATAGFRYKKFKIEASSFTGREPDENRYNFDKPRFDSWSARLSYNPTRNLALQVSQGYIKSPESLHPEENIYRTTASAIHAKQWRNGKMLNSAIIWGYNRVDANHQEHSLLAESAFTFGKNAVYGKYEFVQKSAEELNFPEGMFGHDARFPVNAVTLGYSRHLLTWAKTMLSAGVQGTLYSADQRLHSLYGTTPIAAEAYLRINPARMR